MFSREMNHNSVKAEGGQGLQSSEMFSENTTMGSQSVKHMGLFSCLYQLVQVKIAFTKLLCIGFSNGSGFGNNVLMLICMLGWPLECPRSLSLLM